MSSLPAPAVCRASRRALMIAAGAPVVAFSPAPSGPRMSKGAVREKEGIGRTTSPAISAAVKTSRTPGAARAAAPSTARMRAWA